MDLKILFANVSQGFVYADSAGEEKMVFTKFSIPDYVNWLAGQKADIIAIAEILIDGLIPEIKSIFAEQLVDKSGLSYYRILPFEDSWLYVGKKYGLAVFSKYPISSYDVFKLPNPKFEVDRPNGEHWVLHDKYAQYMQFQVDNKLLNFFNLHYFPVHHFNHMLNDADMRDSREALLKILMNTNSSSRTIVTGDFNNKGLKIQEAFPELFTDDNFRDAINVPTTLVNGHDQLDHILYTPKNIALLESNAEKFLSDHYAVWAKFRI